MKPLTQQILIGISGCIALTLVLSYSLAIAVNYGLMQFENQAKELLPGVVPETQTPQNPMGQ
ncbi:MAG: hypothetical protein MH252_13895 [Thermosynechococcaceae cyanobacterium MS004]|nr:hypothetical protein [Thermosynechococcaceae cyanobacterium MS004]